MFLNWEKETQGFGEESINVNFSYFLHDYPKVWSLARFTVRYVKRGGNQLL